MSWSVSNCLCVRILTFVRFLVTLHWSNICRFSWSVHTKLPRHALLTISGIFQSSICYQTPYKTTPALRATPRRGELEWRRAYSRLCALFSYFALSKHLPNNIAASWQCYAVGIITFLLGWVSVSVYPVDGGTVVSNRWCPRNWCDSDLALLACSESWIASSCRLG